MSEDRNRYLDEMKGKLAEAQAKLEALKVQASLGKMELKDRYEETRGELQERAAALQEKLEQARDSSGDAWTDVKEGLTRAWDELKDGFGKARREFGGDD